MNNKSVKYDILLKGGRVIDPANNIDDLFDVGISGGFIANVGKSISEKDAFYNINHHRSDSFLGLRHSPPNWI